MAMQSEDRIDVSLELFAGPRSQLRPLFEEADDSSSAIDTYVLSGEVLVARTAQQIVGHVQFVTGEKEWEIKSLAVCRESRRRGIGTALVRAVVDRAFSEGANRVVVATATADIENLLFYQRLGFRMERIEPDAFNLESGYAVAQVNGIPLRDRIWFSISAEDRFRAAQR